MNLLREKKCTFQIIHHSVLKNIIMSKLQRQIKFVLTPTYINYLL